MKTLARTWKCLAVLALTAPAVVNARPPMSREWNGTVATVDSTEQTLTVTDGEPCPLAPRWNERTRFVADAQFAGYVITVKDGDKVVGQRADSLGLERETK